MKVAEYIPRMKERYNAHVIEALKESGVKPTAMIDVSDGLSSDLLHLCKASKLGCSLYEEKIPIDPTTINLAEEFNISGSTAALNGGEDYELLFTIDIQDHDKIKNLSGITIIGHMTGKNEAPNLVTNGGSVVELTAQGWDGMK